jgi:hypothetical protein
VHIIIVLGGQFLETMYVSVYLAAINENTGGHTLAGIH